MNLVFPAALVAIGLYLSRSKDSTPVTSPPTGAAKDLHAEIANIGFGWEGLTPILKLNIYIQNASNASFVVRAMSGVILVNGKNYGEASSFGDKQIPPQTEIEYPLQLRLSVGQVYNDLKAIIEKNTGYQAVIQVDGKLNIDGVYYPMQLTHAIV